jgi:hypothetical protein
MKFRDLGKLFCITIFSLTRGYSESCFNHIAGNHLGVPQLYFLSEELSGRWSNRIYVPVIH